MFLHTGYLLKSFKLLIKPSTMQQNRITTNIKQVIKNKIERSKATFIFFNGNEYYLYKGDRIKVNHFDLMFPIDPIPVLIPV